MSCSFRVPLRSLPSLADLRAWASAPEQYGASYSDSSFADGVLSVYVPRLSTTRVALSCAPGGESGQNMLSVVVPDGACEEDFALALHTVQGAARDHEATIELRDGTRLSASELVTHCDAAWVSQQMQAAASTLANLAASREHIIDGPVRPFHFGPKLLTRLSFGDPLPLHVKLRDAMRELQWCEANQNVSVAPSVHLGGKKGYDVARWNGKKRCLIPAVEFVALEAGDGKKLHIPSARIFDIAQSRARPLDERCAIVEPHTPEQWADLLSRAERYQVALPVAPPESDDWDEPTKQKLVERAYSDIRKNLPILSGGVVLARLLVKSDHGAWAALVFVLLLLTLSYWCIRYYRLKHSLGMMHYHASRGLNRPWALALVVIVTTLAVVTLLTQLH